MMDLIYTALREVDSPAVKLNFGSLPVTFYSDKPKYIDQLAEIFRLWPEFTETGDAGLTVFISGKADYYEAARTRAENLDSPIQHEMYSPSVHAHLIGSEVFILIDDTSEVWTYHLMVMWNKVLFKLKKLHVHAAGVRLNGQTTILIGDKGSGKSSMSMAVGKAEGMILGEDHILVAEQDAKFFASGCDGYMRVTQDAEAYFFDQPIPTEPKDFAGTMKKEISISNYFESDPFVDYPIEAIYFPRIGNTIQKTHKPALEAVLYSMERFRARHRFYGGKDTNEFVDYLTRLYQSAPVYDLELSPRLEDIPQAVELLHNG